jgi:hypothetical protein
VGGSGKRLLGIRLDPGAWRIVDGKLYLSYDKGFATEIAVHSGEYLSKAEANWPALKAKLAQGEFK